MVFEAQIINKMLSYIFRCSFEALQRSLLRRHMQRHIVQKQAVCSLCDYSCNSAGYLQSHYKQVHSIEKSTSWHARSRSNNKLCKRNKSNQDKRYINNAVDANVSYLMETTGATSKDAAAGNVPYPERLFRCLSCNYIFSCTYDLKKHLISKHRVEVDNLVSLKDVKTSQVLQVAGTEDSQTIVEIGIEVRKMLHSLT